MYKSYTVYILKCNDGTFYTGLTNDINRRLTEHSSGAYKTAYTYTRRPVKLMWHSEFSNVGHAIEVEKQIKRWSSRKKLALINGDWELLKQLAQCRNASHYLKNAE